MYIITKSFIPSILLRACTEREDILYVHDNPMRKIVNEGDPTHTLSLSHTHIKTNKSPSMGCWTEKARYQ
jgi:hypothetical protein